MSQPTNASTTNRAPTNGPTTTAPAQVVDPQAQIERPVPTPSDPRTIQREREQTERRSRDERMVRIEGGVVGSMPSYTRGQLVPASAFPDVDHLIEIGAVVEADEGDPGWTLYNAMRSESPPTLPNAPHVDATDREKLVAAGAIPPERLRDNEKMRAEEYPQVDNGKPLGQPQEQQTQKS